MRDALDGPLRELGYERPRGQQTFWSRPSGRAYLNFWIQLDKFGYSPNLGGKLWLVCQSNNRMDKLAGDETLSPTEVCSTAQLKRFEAAKRSVLTRVLRNPDMGIDELFRDFEEDDLEQPYRRGDMMIMPYLDLKDVERWANLLAPVLPAMDAEMTRRLAHKTTQVARATGRGNPRRPRRR